MDPDSDACVAGVSPSDGLQTLRQVEVFYQEFSASYDEAAGEAGWLPNEALRDELPALPPRPSVLDLCCGTGLTLDILTRSFPGALLVGVDLSSAMLGRARERVPDATYVHDDVRAYLEGTRDRFDLVTGIGGFEYVPDLPGLLDHLRWVVRPGGHVVFTYEPVIRGWPAQAASKETNLGSNGLELTTFRWEASQIEEPLREWCIQQSRLLVSYYRDGLPTIYTLVHGERALSSTGCVPRREERRG